MKSQLVRSGTLLFLDVVGLYCAYNLAHKIRLDQWVPQNSGFLWALIAVGILAFYVMDVYRISHSRGPGQMVIDTLIAIVVMSVASVVVVYLIGVAHFMPVFGRGVLPVGIIIFAIWAASWRWALTTIFKRLEGILRWLVIVEKQLSNSVISELESRESGNKISWIDPKSHSQDIKKWTQKNSNRSGIIFDSNTKLSKEVLDSLWDLEQQSVFVLSLIEYYEQYWKKLPVSHLEEGWFARNLGHNLLHDRIGIRLKRIADFIFGSVGLLLMAPIIVLIGAIVYLDSPGAVIYKQRRVGLHGDIFTLHKFRTMHHDAEKSGAQWSKVDDPRITKIGKILRASRLDELPQLYNLVIGNMSLIGPRPERPEFVESLMSEVPFYEMRLLVPPGLTGWAQVMYSYGSSVDDAKNKLEFDLYYIKNHSIRLDIAIMIKTVLVIFRGGGR